MCSCRIDLCNYSGYKCYPSRGITYVKADGKTFFFLDGVEEETAEKRTKRTLKFQRAIIAALNEILAKSKGR